jgi:hypothetical protein
MEQFNRPFPPRARKRARRGVHSHLPFDHSFEGKVNTSISDIDATLFHACVHMFTYTFRHSLIHETVHALIY